MLVVKRCPRVFVNSCALADGRLSMRHIDSKKLRSLGSGVLLLMRCAVCLL